MRYLITGYLLIATMPALADVKFEREAIRLGEVRSGAPLYQQLRFTNLGKSPMTITGVRVSCGCLKPRLDRTTYRPGEKGRLLFMVHTLGESAGPQTWKVFFQYEQDGKRREKTLTVSATIRKEIIVQPASMLIRARGAVRHRITLTDTRAKPLKVRHLLTSADAIQAKLLRTTENEAGQTVHEMEVTVAETLPAGQRHEMLSIITDDELYPELRVPMTIEKHSEQSVRASPPMIRLTGSKGAALPSRIVLLRGDGEVEVDRILSKHPAVTCRWAKGPDRMATVKILIDAKKIDKDELRTSVDVWLSGPSIGSVTIPIRCELR